MTNKEAIELLKYERDNDIFVRTEHREKIHQAITLAIEALKLADEVEEASKKIGMRYYGPDVCATCAHATPSTDHSTTMTFCEHYGLKVNDFDHCEHYKERR